MAIFQDYDKKRKQLAKKLQTYKEFEKTDKVVGKVFAISRNVVTNPGDYQSIDTLLYQGRQLSGYFGYLEAMANEQWGKYKVAEVAWKHVKDGLMIAYKAEKMNTTEARAQAGREMADAEVDAIAREQRYKNYATSAKMCEQIISFIQTTLKNKKQEQDRAGKIADGRHGQKEKRYVLKKDCKNIGKEIGDYYNNEYSDSIEELINKGIIELEKNN